MRKTVKRTRQSSDGLRMRVTRPLSAINSVALHTRLPRSLFRSVRGRLILLVGAITIPALLLAAVLIFQAYRDQRDSVAKPLQSTARAMARVIDGEMREAETLLKALGSGKSISQDDMPGVYAVAQRSLINDSRWFVIEDLDGQQLLNTRVPLGTPLPRIPPIPEEVEALNHNKTYVSDLTFGPVAKTMLVYVFHPYIRDGKTKYGLSLAMEPSTLAKALDIERIAPGSVLTVIDRKGTIIARSRSPEKFVGGRATPDVVAAAAKAPEGLLESVTLEHIPVLTAHCRAQCGWTVIIGAPEAEPYASARRLLMIGLTWSVLVAGVALAIALWIARALLRSVDALTSDAAAMARGRLPGPPASGLEETDFVARAMHRTAEALLRRTRILEALNRVSAGLVAERDPEKIMDAVTRAGREISGASVGASFKMQMSASGRGYYLVASAGPQEWPQPRSEPLPAPIANLLDEGAFVRIHDITTRPGWREATSPRAGGIAVKSLLAAPITDSSGEISVWLLFVHPEANAFTQEAEESMRGLAAEAAIAIENAKLYQVVQRELEAKTKAESELRVAQQRLHEYAQELERKVEERTASLRDAITQMEEFSYTVSHDLRSPLRALSGYASVLLEDYGDRLDDVGRDYLQRIKRASARMDNLTTGVLSYSRVARAQVVLAPTDVERIVRSLIEQYSELHPEAAEVNVVVPMHPVYAHDLSLTQCLANLLTNAAKFVRRGEKPRITVRTELRGNRVRIWVEDRGIGIPPQHQTALFKIFERVPSKENYEGTGVGLAIVRKATEKMAGQCGVESNGDNGSRFWIELAAAL